MVQPISVNLNNVNMGRKNSPQKFNGDFSAPSTMLPEGERNFCLFNQNKVDFIVSQKEGALPYLKQVLQTSDDEKEVVEALYIMDRLCDNGTKGIPAMYPVLARFNDTKSANIQTFLAGIYRKTQVPDAFGPLVVMLIRNAMSSEAKCKVQSAKCHCEERSDEAIQKECYSPIHPFTYSPEEEIGGAILEYIENYSNNPKQIDYLA